MIAYKEQNKFKTDGVVSFKILINEQEVTSKISLVSFSVFHAVNRISTADLVLLDGSIPKQRFDLSNDEHFIPGNKISIQLGYKMEDKSVFEGVIISQKVIANSEGTQLEIQCKSENYAMTLNRKSNIFYDVTESDVLEEIISKYNIKKDVASLNIKHNELVQYRCTDWDFLVSRAQLSGCMVYQDEKTLTIAKPDITKEPIQSLTLGDNIFSIEMEMDARNQSSSYSSKTWNFSDQEVEVIEGEKSLKDKAGNISPQKLADESHKSTSELVHAGSLSSEQITNWVDAKKQWQELSKIKGTIQVQGYHTYKPLECVDVQGVSDRFNGVHLITEVNHIIDKGSWYTNLKLGVSSEWFMEEFQNVSELPASAIIPSISGLHIGTVTALEGDVEGEHRIQVSLPMLIEGAEGVWARVLNLYAGNEFGMQFLPEIGTEVLLGFLNDDPNQAVVLGGMHSQTNVAPIPYTDDNFIKTIVSQSKLKIEFDDEKVACRIETPKGNKIHLDEDEGLIKMEDESGNKIILSSDGISIESSKDIIIKASGDINCSGINIEQKASAQYKADGGAGIEVSSSATAVLKGSLVQIN